MAKSKIVKANEKIAEKVTQGFRKISDTVVEGYAMASFYGSIKYRLLKFPVLSSAESRGCCSLAFQLPTLDNLPIAVFLFYRK